jgi:hypothetical protein
VGSKERLGGQAGREEVGGAGGVGVEAVLREAIGMKTGCGVEEGMG